MYGNRIAQLPTEVCNLKKLRTLALNENLLASLPGTCSMACTCTCIGWMHVRRNACSMQEGVCGNLHQIDMFGAKD